MTEKISQEIYDEVAQELLLNNIKPGLWARALAESDGDEYRAKGAYIKLRALEIQSEIENLQKEALRRKEAEKRKHNHYYKPVSAKLPKKKRRIEYCIFIKVCTYFHSINPNNLLNFINP